MSTKETNMDKTIQNVAKKKLPEKGGKKSRSADALRENLRRRKEAEKHKKG